MQLVNSEMPIIERGVSEIQTRLRKTTEDTGKTDSQKRLKNRATVLTKEKKVKWN